MAFALKASPYLSSSSAAASSSSSPALLPLPGQHASARVSFRPQAALTAPLAMGQAAAAAAAEKCNVSQTFSRLRKQGKTAFIPYITAGDPDLATTAAALKLLDYCGADVIELGLPYSDPIADGPVIQASASRALAKGATLDTTMAMLKEVVPHLSCPVVLFTYYNPIMRRGVANFTAAAKEAGAHGLVVPDLPLENAGILRNESIKNKLELVQLTTPVTPTGRMVQITQAAQGFVYLVSVVGVTGARSNVNPRVQHLLQEIKQVTDKAVAVGFGISTPEHVKQVAQWGADGVIIGSAMVRQLGEASSPQEGLRRLEAYAKSLKAALP